MIHIITQWFLVWSIILLFFSITFFFLNWLCYLTNANTLLLGRRFNQRFWRILIIIVLATRFWVIIFIWLLTFSNGSTTLSLNIMHRNQSNSLFRLFWPVIIEIYPRINFRINNVMFIHRNFIRFIIFSVWWKIIVPLKEIAWIIILWLIWFGLLLIVFVIFIFIITVFFTFIILLLIIFSSDHWTWFFFRLLTLELLALVITFLTLHFYIFLPFAFFFLSETFTASSFLWVIIIWIWRWRPLYLNEKVWTLLK